MALFQPINFKIKGRFHAILTLQMAKSAFANALIAIKEIKSNSLQKPEERDVLAYLSKTWKSWCPLRDYIAETDDKELALRLLEIYPNAKALCSCAKELEFYKVIHQASIVFTTIRVLANHYHFDIPEESTRFAMDEEEANEYLSILVADEQDFTTKAALPLARLYKFLAEYVVKGGPDNGKPLINANEISDADFMYAVSRADYSKVYPNSVKGKMRCVITLFSKGYFNDWKQYRSKAALSIGIEVNNLTKYNVDDAFISSLKEQFSMIK